jgi:hypothetical protein
VSLAFTDQRPSCLPILALILSLVASASPGVRANGPQTSTAAQGVIAGRVVDATGAPVARAAVKVDLSEQENLFARHPPFGEGNSNCRQSLGVWVSGALKP